MNTPHPFGHALRDVRAALNLSQLALAEELSSTQRHISFLETGRSQPTPHFLSRICSELGLSAGQRASLFEASGYENPYRKRSIDDAEITETLDLIEARILGNWPFPALVMDEAWRILRMNNQAKAMLAGLMPQDANTVSFLSLLISPAFRSFVTNWDEVCPALYFRLQTAAAHDATMAQELETAKATGIFDNVADLVREQGAIPAHVPTKLALPGGINIAITSFMGRIAAAQDALVERLEIELIVPIDDASDQMMRTMFGG